jgi:hypothetical protein
VGAEVAPEIPGATCCHGHPGVEAGARSPSPTKAETVQGTLWLHLKMLKGLGDPDSLHLHHPVCPLCEPPCSATSAQAIFIPHHFPSTANVGWKG